MRFRQRAITFHYLNELIALLDEERETRACPRRPALVSALNTLRDEALHDGASDRTVGLIHAAEVVLALREMPTDSGALQ